MSFKSGFRFDVFTYILFGIKMINYSIYTSMSIPIIINVILFH